MKIGFVVLSCDKYSDLWEPFFGLLFKYWPDCPFKIYLFSNEKKFDHPRVTTILSGPDSSWAGSVKKCLQQLDEDYVFLFFDDVFLNRPVKQDDIALLTAKLNLYQPDYLRFRPVPKPDQRIDEAIGVYGESTLYRTAVFAIWKRAVLESLLFEGESAWDLEMKGLKRASIYKKFYGVYREYFSYWHGVEKGTWDADVVRHIRSEGFPVATDRRREKTPQEMKIWKRALFKEMIFNNTPAFMRPGLIRASRVVKKILAE